VEVPEFVIEALVILKKRATHEEGLFRISGSHTKMQELKKKIDSGKKVNLEKEAGSLHTVSGLLKQYLRELPTQLIPGKKLKHLMVRAAGTPFRFAFTQLY
jgi:hypothetical protein